MNELLAMDGMMVMFLLGLRHGLDPDHIAIVDSMTYRDTERDGRRAMRAGTLFALGHGLAVTAAGLALHGMRGDIAPAPWLAATFEWLPVALLLLVGSLNLKGLLRAREFRPAGWLGCLVPRLKDGGAAAMFVVGILFALVFDTAGHLAALGREGNGVTTAILLGIAFTAGMVVVDAFDARMVGRLLARSGPADVLRYRRSVGWLIVIAAYGVAAYGIASAAWPALALGEDALTLVGLLMVAAMALLPLSQRGARRATAGG